MNNYCLKKGNMYLQTYNLDGFNKSNCITFCMDKDESMDMSYDEAGVIADLIVVLLEIKLEREMK
jgi:hypothetical protein